MDELKEIILHKLRTIAEYRDKINKNQNCGIYAEQLLREKKKQNSREVVQSRLLQSLLNRKIQAPYRIEYAYHNQCRQFYADSLYMMNIYDANFQYKSTENKDIFGNIIEMYAKFFEEQKCSRRADQLRHIYKKKLCEKSLLVPTIFNWFVEWVRKTFNHFIKSTLLELNQPVRINRQNQKNLRKAKFDKQLQIHRKSIQKIKMSLRSNKEEATILYIKKSELIDINQRVGQNESNILSMKKIQSSRKHLDITKQENLQKQNTARQYSKMVNSPSIASNLNNIGLIKEQSNFYGINKEVLYASFAEQFGNYYKFAAALIPDLDAGYLKTHRRVDKREQIKSKMSEVVKSLLRAQPQIKKSIDMYSEQYFNKFNKKKQQKQKQKKNQPLNTKIEKQKNKLVKQVSKMFGIEQKEEQNKLIDKNSKQDMKHRKSKSMNCRTSLEKKSTILQLPDIKTGQNIINREPSKLKKFLLINSNRYSSQLQANIIARQRISISTNQHYNSKADEKMQNTPKQRVSTDLINDFKYEINQKLFHLSPVNDDQHGLKISKSRAILRKSAKRRKKKQEGLQKQILKINEEDPEKNLSKSMSRQKLLPFSKKISDNNEYLNDENNGVFYLPRIKN